MIYPAGASRCALAQVVTWKWHLRTTSPMNSASSADADADENGSNPVRLLKSHVRREKGPTPGPGGPSVAGRGAHVSTAGKRSGAKTKKFEVPILPPEDLSVP